MLSLSQCSLLSMHIIPGGHSGPLLQAVAQGADPTSSQEEFEPQPNHSGRITVRPQRPSPPSQHPVYHQQLWHITVHCGRSALGSSSRESPQVNGEL